MTVPTLPRLLMANAALAPSVVAMREKRRGIWACRTWAEYAADVGHLAAGLADLGFGRGDKLALIGDNRAALYDAILASQALGGVPLPLYQDSSVDELRYVVAHSEATVVVAEDQEQVDKLLALADSAATIEHIVFVDPRGLSGYTDPRLVSYSDVVARGRGSGAAGRDRIDAAVAEGDAGDVALISYTSGTTGRPKGVMLTHAALVSTCDRVMACEPSWREGDEDLLAYLPMAWAGDTFLTLALALRARFRVNIPEEPETVARDLREAGPTVFVAPPRVWENMLRDVELRVQDSSWLKRRLYRTFVDRAAQAVAARMAGEQGRPSARERVLGLAGELLVYAPLRDHLGLSRVRSAYAGGAALGTEALQRLRGIGVNAKQVYGLTEAGVLAAHTRDGDLVCDAVGRPLPGVEVAISPTSEVLIRSGSLFAGYYKDPAATAAAMTADGWLRSGDVGYIDSDGHLFVLDRAADLALLTDGTSFAPQVLENKLRFSPYVREAVVVGDRRPFVAALVNIDATSVGKWADKHHVVYAGYADLARQPAVYELIAAEIDRVNTELPAALHIRRFLCLHKELDPDDAEITRTRKLRRRLIGERYAALIDALYDGSNEIAARMTVTFEDGRVTETEALVPIRSMNGHAAHGDVPAGVRTAEEHR